jgi:hypothetical protein
VGVGARWSLCKAGGGYGDRQQLVPGQEFGRRAPRAVVYFSNNYRPDPGRDSAMLRPATTRDLRTSRREVQGEIVSIFAAHAPQGRLKTAEEGFPQRFPSSRRGPRSFTPFCTNTHRRWGSIGSRGVAADRDRRGGGGRTGSYGANRGDTSTDTESHAKGLALGQCPLHRQDASAPEAACAPSGVSSILGSPSLCFPQEAGIMQDISCHGRKGLNCRTDRV